MDIGNYIENILSKAIESSGFSPVRIQFDIPKEEKFGDMSSNAALLIAKANRIQPRKVAEEIVNNIKSDPGIVNKIEIAGPGFINFFIADNFYKENLSGILKQKSSYGKSDINKDKTANLEWVSANPTGPLHAGHGRQIALGKAIANLLEWTGYKVTREYYYNDAGNQMNNLAKSVYARYMEIFKPDFPFPEDGYAGDYIKEIARKIFEEKGDSLVSISDMEFFKNYGEEFNFALIKNSLNRLGIHHDVFFNETSLYKNSDIDRVIEDYKNNGLAYESEGALWLRMNKDKNFQKDKVIVKSSGEPTYRLPDIAYHINKINRGFDLIVDIFGSDHRDTYREVLYGVESLGYDIDKIRVIIHQMVTFKMGDESFKMSKRSDKTYSLDDLIDDIGPDATQFFFVMRGANTHLDFDVELAKEQSEKNPVYYLQYAHARICGILRNADEHLPEYKNSDIDKINLELISTEDEIKLLKVLSKFPAEILSSSVSYEPHKIITFLNAVAEQFHRFYHNNRVVDTGNIELSKVRLLICLAVKYVLKNGFDIIGISAPEKM